MTASSCFFRKDSEDPIFQKMYAKMDNMPDNKPGVQRVIESKGDYAFFMESSSIEYQASRECGVRKVGSNLDEKGYGIAMRKSKSLYSYRNILSVQLISIKPEFIMDYFYQTPHICQRYQQRL